MSHSTISLIAAGKRTPPLENIEAWADALNLTGTERDQFLVEAHLAHCPAPIAARFRQLEATITALEARMDASERPSRPNA